MKKTYKLKNKKRFFAILFIIFTIMFSVIFTDITYGYKEIEYDVIVVKNGDTLWGIAKQYKKDQDIRKFIYKIKQVNNLKSSSLYEGDVIKIPADI